MSDAPIPSTTTSSSTQPAPPRLLHLGCGLIAPPEWVNVDGSLNAWLAQHRLLRKIVTTLRLVPKSQTAIDWPTNVTIADLRKRLPFADGQFDAVFSSHTVEHLYRAQALGLLKEAFRVIKPGGICRTLVPDMRAMVREYLGEIEMKWFEDESLLIDDPCRRLVTRMLFRAEEAPRGGFFYRLYHAMTDHHWHKWLYDGPSLVRLMTEAGFVDCRQRGLHESAIPHIDKVEMPHRVLNGVGVVVEGAKPTTSGG